MNLSLYHPGTGPLHRLPAGVKLAALAVLGIVGVVVASPLALATMAGGGVLLLVATGLRRGWWLRR
ncbi:hypothetical protein [Methylobrevis pamukkalensis]|uniref:Energy-coupling factor transporter transmembrane protein EcfT n=1 Tax=Methylobrevis pamukkalensis TaxID=1439726 RepID=A0A1E3H084_9HYPH|nr:hypothetical protein [Methylobrevis pamukkalensis]ODN69702.1 hypothetical protein A6302_02996 [Methylobrevis pamukkalensis]